MQNYSLCLRLWVGFQKSHGSIRSSGGPSKLVRKINFFTTTSLSHKLPQFDTRNRCSYSYRIACSTFLLSQNVLLYSSRIVMDVGSVQHASQHAIQHRADRNQRQHLYAYDASPVMPFTVAFCQLPCTSSAGNTSGHPRAIKHSQGIYERMS